MDKETLSNYGWIVICILVLSVMIALATPFGTYIGNAVKSTTEGLFQVEQKALGAAGLVIGDQNFDDANNDQSGGSGGETLPPAINENGFYYDQPYEFDRTAVVYFRDDNTVDIAYAYWSIYYITGTFTINENEVTISIPDSDEIIGVLQNGGKSIYVADMEATFVMKQSDNNLYIDGDYIYAYDIYDNGDGYRVLVKDKTQTEYGPILESINGRPVTDMTMTFNGCTNLKVAPAIPNGITNLSWAFDGCTSLKIAPPSIPNSVTDMSCTFNGCTSLVTAPTIPDSVTDMQFTFQDCTSLTGTITINVNQIPLYGDCFAGVDFEAQNITLTGTSPMLDTLGGLGTNYCAECNGKCNGGH